jgi:hypothetical protein
MRNSSNQESQSNWTGVAVTIWNCIREFLGSILGWWTAAVLIENFCGTTYSPQAIYGAGSRICHDDFLPNPFQFTIHLSPYHSKSYLLTVSWNKKHEATLVPYHSPNLKMETAGSSEKFLPFYQTTPRQIIEHNNFNFTVVRTSRMTHFSYKGKLYYATSVGSKLFESRKRSR